MVKTQQKSQIIEQSVNRSWSASQAVTVILQRRRPASWPINQPGRQSSIGLMTYSGNIREMGGKKDDERFPFSRDKYCHKLQSTLHSSAGPQTGRNRLAVNEWVTEWVNECTWEFVEVQIKVCFKKKNMHNQTSNSIGVCFRTTLTLNSSNRARDQAVYPPLHHETSLFSLCDWLYIICQGHVQMSACPDWARLNVKGIKFLRTNKTCQDAADVHSQHFKGRLAN